MPELDTARRTAPKPRPKARRSPGQRLNFADRYRLLETHRKNPDWSYHALAEQCGVSVETARMTCVAAGRDTAELMSAFAAPMLKLWMLAARAAAKRGDHRPAKEWLLHAGTIEPLPDTSRFGGTTINIVNSPLPGTASTLTIDTADRQIPAAPAAGSTLINPDDDNIGGS